MARYCPRDKKVMRETPMREAIVDVCGACHGTFFDSGEMFTASGISADPSTWDRPETGGVVKDGALICPRCENVVMKAQDVTHDGKHVEIDRCGKCGGIWLDKNELDTIVAIGDALRPLIDASREKAQQELAAMGTVDFRPPTVKKWKIAAFVVLLGVLGTAAYALLQPPPPPPPGPRTRAKDEEGCPCGCDRSAKMAADLRMAHATRADDAAPRAIERSLVTIGEREKVGYITERMIQHRLRLLDLADELHVDTTPALARSGATVARCKVAAFENDVLRVCPELIVHGERTEIVDGHPKHIESCFRLWLEIENLTDDDRTLPAASIDGGSVHFPVSRWYEEGGQGNPWNGVLGARQKRRINVIGYIPEHIEPGTAVSAAIAVESLVLHASTEARAVIHLTEP